jgi:hypothetical protein
MHAHSMPVRVENELGMLEQPGIWPESLTYEPVAANMKH